MDDKGKINSPMTQINNFDFYHPQKIDFGYDEEITDYVNNKQLKYGNTLGSLLTTVPYTQGSYSIYAPGGASKKQAKRFDELTQMTNMPSTELASSIKRHIQTIGNCVLTNEVCFDSSHNRFGERGQRILTYKKEVYYFVDYSHREFSEKDLKGLVLTLTACLPSITVFSSYPENVATLRDRQPVDYHFLEGIALNTQKMAFLVYDDTSYLVWDRVQG